MIITRVFAMPSPDTFSIRPIADLLNRWLKAEHVSVDPFARNSTRATITNDLNPSTAAMFHMKAEDFVLTLEPASADVALFDPPYSPRQISEVYQQVGLACGTKDTQNARLYKSVKDGLHAALKPGGVAICCGWNTMGFGLGRGYTMEEILIVAHGGAHNDTLVTVERKQ